MKYVSLAALVLLLVAITATNFFAFNGYWYWVFKPLDMIMHFAVGLWIASVLLWVHAYLWRSQQHKSRTYAGLMSVLIVVFIGAVWEIFEFSQGGLVLFPDHYLKDTGSDMLCNFAGALLAAIAYAMSARGRQHDEAASGEV